MQGKDNNNFTLLQMIWNARIALHHITVRRMSTAMYRELLRLLLFVLYTHGPVLYPYTHVKKGTIFSEVQQSHPQFEYLSQRGDIVTHCHTYNDYY